MYTAPRVGVLIGGVHVAVRGTQSAREGTTIGDVTAIRSVKRHRIVGSVIDSFDDVDLAAVWPGGTEKPAKSSSVKPMLECLNWD